MTLLLSRSDLEQVLDVRACLEVLGQGFLAAPSAIGPQRIRTDLPGPGTATVLLPAQDLALAWAAYQQARRAGGGHEYDFLA